MALTGPLPAVSTELIHIVPDMEEKTSEHTGVMLLKTSLSTQS